MIVWRYVFNSINLKPYIETKELSIFFSLRPIFIIVFSFLLNRDHRRSILIFHYSWKILKCFNWNIICFCQHHTLCLRDNVFLHKISLPLEWSWVELQKVIIFTLTAKFPSRASSLVGFHFPWQPTGMVSG